MPRARQEITEKHTDILEQKKVLRQLADYNLTCVHIVFEEDSTGPEGIRILETIKKQTKELAKADRRIDIEVEALTTAAIDVSEELHEDNMAGVTNAVQQKVASLTDADILAHRFVWEIESDISFHNEMHKSVEKGNRRSAIITGDVTGELKDPFTQVPIRQAMRNKVCGHVYEESVLMKQLRENAITGSVIKCPAVGCRNKEAISMDSVIVDYEYESRQRFTQSQK